MLNYNHHSLSHYHRMQHHMCYRLIHKLTALLIASCLFFSSSTIGLAQTLAALEFDITAPSISHDVPQNAGIAGQKQTVSAKIVDNVAVKRATVHYLRSNAEQFQQIDMTDTGTATWVALIDTETTDNYVLYYIVAEDKEGNKIQKGGLEKPLKMQLDAGTSFSPSTNLQAQTGKSTNTGHTDSEPKKPNWLFIGLGIVVAGLLISSSGGGNDSNGSIQSDDTCCTVTFTVEEVGAGR